MVTEQKYSVLIVEDEANIANALCFGLSREGYAAVSVFSGEEALFELSKQSFDLMILDIMLPGRDGFEILKILRSKKDKTLVLMLTARDSIEDRVAGLDSGADDYLVKPFAFAELLARVRVLLKRSKQMNNLIISHTDLEMNLVTREVFRGKTKLELTVKEFEVLEYLLRHQGEIVTREMLARDIWKETSRATPIDNVIDVHMARLRKKVDQDSTTILINTVRGVGFILREKNDKI